MKAILLITLVLLSGCAEYRALVASYGAESADGALQSAEWTVCTASSAGALERRYHLYSVPTGPVAQGWLGLCHGKEQTREIE